MEHTYEEYEELLLERDRVRKEAGQVWTAYIRCFGQLITDVYEEKLECIRRRKIIAYCQRILCRGGTVDAAALEKHLDREMASYAAHLRQMLSDSERCREAKLSTVYEAERSKTLYRRLAKLLHPDLHPETDREPALTELWARAVEAYGKNDVRTLAELEVLARRALKALGVDAGRAEVSGLDERIDAVREEIEDITQTEPYTHKYLLDDADAVEKRKRELAEELVSYRACRRELGAVVGQILQKGGIRIQWQMN